MLGNVKAEQTRAIAAQNRRGGKHFGIDQCAAREQAMEKPTMAVGPFHHRCNTKAPVQHTWHFIISFQCLMTFSYNSGSDRTINSVRNLPSFAQLRRPGQQFYIRADGSIAKKSTAPCVDDAHRSQRSDR